MAILGKTTPAEKIKDGRKMKKTPGFACDRAW
jgi:hypothetical protein